MALAMVDLLSHIFFAYCWCDPGATLRAASGETPGRKKEASGVAHAVPVTVARAALSLTAPGRGVGGARALQEPRADTHT